MPKYKLHIKYKPELQQSRMFIQLDKYCWNSLRKGRLLGFQNDIEEAFTVFKNHMFQPHNINIKQFKKITEASQFRFIINCKAEQQDQEEYVQLLYQILIQNYFMSKNNDKQIFSTYSLYFLYCQLQRKRKINVDMDFLDQYLSFITRNSSESQHEFMIISRKLFQNCINIGIKTGLKTYLIKQNGQPARKGRYSNTIPNRKIETKSQQMNQQKSQQRNYLNSLRTQLSGLQINLQAYTKGKSRYNSQLASSQNKLSFSDRNLGIVLIKRLNQYEKLISEKYDQETRNLN